VLNHHVVGYAYSDCRLLGHLWHVVPSDWTPRYGVPMTVRCERCNMERRDEVNRNTGDVESRRYVEPAGYGMKRDDDADVLPRRVDFRLAWIEQEVEALHKRRHQ
jgi:hypothetical protein